MNYEFNDEEMNYILAVLGERPYIEAVDLINKIHQQYERQVKQESTE